MRVALRLARRGCGATSPNPMVGICFKRVDWFHSHYLKMEKYGFNFPTSSAGRRFGFSSRLVQA